MRPDWLAADWPAPDGVVAGTTTRTGGVSTGVYESLNLGAHVGDDAASVADNRSRFVEACGLSQEPFWLTQVHGDRVVDAGTSEPAPEADAAVSSGSGLVIMTADCLPVLFCSDDGDEIAACHCGWRGLAAGIIENTVAAMRSRPEALLAWLGPAISQAAFEVGDDVREAFLARTPDAAACFEANERGRWQADLYGLARQALNAAGVTRVHGGSLCTYSDPARFYSYRRDGQTGRMATFIYRQ